VAVNVFPLTSIDEVKCPEAPVTPSKYIFIVATPVDVENVGVSM
jgi:hypothetical protein